MKTMAHDQFDAFVPKGWGFEHVVVNTPKYCGKRLFLLAGRRTSWHWHRKKTETLYVASGLVEITCNGDDWVPLHRSQENGDHRRARGVFDASAGAIFHVPRGLRHRFRAIEDTWLLEFSTHDDPADSIKVERGDVLPGER